MSDWATSGSALRQMPAVTKWLPTGSRMLCQSVAIWGVLLEKQLWRKQGWRGGKTRWGVSEPGWEGGWKKMRHQWEEVDSMVMAHQMLSPHFAVSLPPSSLCVSYRTGTCLRKPTAEQEVYGGVSEYKSSPSEALWSPPPALYSMLIVGLATPAEHWMLHIFPNFSSCATVNNECMEVRTETSDVFQLSFPCIHCSLLHMKKILTVREQQLLNGLKASWTENSSYWSRVRGRYKKIKRALLD